MAFELSAGNVWVETLTRNGPGSRRRGPRAGPTSKGQGPGLSAADTIADSEDWTLQPGTTLGATAPVKRRVFIQGLHMDAPAATPTFDKGGRTRIDPSGRGIRANEGGLWDETLIGRTRAAGRGTRLFGSNTHTASAMARLRLGRTTSLHMLESSHR